jgi:hypothetical protein
MPEIILCKHCRQPIDKEADQYVIIEKGSDRLPESLAHVPCEQKRPTGFGFEEWIRTFRWPGRS